MSIIKSAPTLDDNDQLPTRFLPPGYLRGVRGGLATLDPVTGEVLDANGEVVSGTGGVPNLNDAALTGNSTADTPLPEAAGTEIVTAEWVREIRMTLANAIPGYIHPVKCWDGVQLPRATFTDRTDVFIRWLMPEQPNYATGYAIVGDRWSRELWTSP